MSEEAEFQPLVPMRNRVEDTRREQQEQPLKRVIWENPPETNPDRATTSRWKEFFRGEEVPAEVRAIAALCTQTIVDAAESIERSSFMYALYNEGRNVGRPTIYGMMLYSDRVDLLFSSLADYGEYSVTAASIPLSQLDQISGSVATELSRQRPDVVNGLLSDTPTQEHSAKVSFMRFAASEKPGHVKIIGDFGGTYTTGVAYSADLLSMTMKLYIGEIPDTDPLLGEAVELYREFDAWERTITSLKDFDHSQMTVHQIEDKLRKMPPFLKTVFFKGSPYPNYDGASWDVLRMFQKMGYKGNEAQQTWEKASELGLIFCGFKSDYAKAVLSPLTSAGQSVEVTDAQIDQLFRDSFDRRRDKKCPPEFSITAAIRDRSGLADLPNPN